jgi:hypothetical protein
MFPYFLFFDVKLRPTHGLNNGALLHPMVDILDDFKSDMTMPSRRPSLNLHQRPETCQGNLHSNAKDEKGGDSVDDLFTPRPDAVNKTGSIGITDIDHQAHNKDGYKNRT